MKTDWNHLWEDYAAAAQENPAQAYRRDLVMRLLAPPGQSGPARIVDLGSGQGDLVLDLDRRFPGADLRGLDLSAVGVRMAQEKVPRGSFLEADLGLPLALPEGWAGWATHMVCTELLEHVAEPATVLANARPLLAPGARVVITVPSGPMSAFDRHLGHLRHFRPEDLIRCMEAAGLRPVKVWRAGFPFFNLYRLVVILRGRRLIRDAARFGADGPQPWLATAVMAIFRQLFRFNGRRGPGWQLVGVAENPGPPA